MKYTKEDFQQLDFDDRCAIIEELLPDDYYGGQTEINFYVPEGFTGEIGEPLPQTPSEIENIEDEKFEQLVLELTEKLFREKEKIEVEI
jgi:hypothetical protein